MACETLSYPTFIDAHTPVTHFLASHAADFKPCSVLLPVCLMNPPQCSVPDTLGTQEKPSPIREPHG